MQVMMWVITTGQFWSHRAGDDVGHYDWSVQEPPCIVMMWVITTCQFRSHRVCDDVGHYDWSVQEPPCR